MSFCVRHFKLLCTIWRYILSVSDKFSQQLYKLFTSAWLHNVAEIILKNGPKSGARETLNMKSFLITITCYMYSVKGM